MCRVKLIHSFFLLREFLFFLSKYLYISYFSFIFASMKKIFCIIILSSAFMQVAFAQQACMSKLSPMLRQYVMQERADNRQCIMSKQVYHSSPITTAFVKVSGNGEQILRENGCQVLARWGNICIAFVPMQKVASLSMLPEIKRIEANMNKSCTMDSAVIQTNALPVYEGRNLPQAYTGKGVVMGIMDIGFDLTHPNFCNHQMTEYRIKALWDQISSDTLQSSLPVGRDYVGKEALLGIGCSRDGHDQTHGTHTLGIAAGSGCEGVPMTMPGKFHGIAYESDICLVANATTENQALIDPSQIFKFTYAMDALGFKYIFDYADKMSKPCVISFSEGANQDFEGGDVLYNEILDSLTSVPGHVIVSSAGNNGHLPYYSHKPLGKESAGFFVNNSSSYVYHIAKSKEPFVLRTTIYQGRRNPTPIDVATDEVLAQPDSTYIDSLEVAGKRYVLMIGAYPSCYQPDEICYDWLLKKADVEDETYVDSEEMIGTSNYLSYQVIGKGADVEVYHGSGNMFASSADPSLSDIEYTHSINSPSCAESVICVGATVNHTYSINMAGEKVNVIDAPIGSLAFYSSIGPTFDNRTKPDVVAPGSNVLSSYSSYYEESHPDANDVINSDVARFEYHGRTYAWNNNAGTSMSSPVVGGAIALWLEANPKLGRDDVMEIIRKTSKPLDAEHEVPNNYWGYGEIDVYRGLLAALQVDGIKEISHNQPSDARIGINGNQVVVDLNTVSSGTFRVSVYNMGGVKLMEESVQAGLTHYSLDVSHLPSGVYIVQVSEDKRIEGSTLVRKNQ